MIRLKIESTSFLLPAKHKEVYSRGCERLSHRQESRERCKNDLYRQDGLSNVVELRVEVDRVQITLETEHRSGF